jgi:hypothetical protein
VDTTSNQPSEKQQSVESDSARKAFEDYWLMGDKRTLADLAMLYQSSSKPVPTKHIATLKIWSSKFNWQKRIADRITQEAARERQRQRLEERKMRIKLQTDYREKVEKAITFLKPNKASWSDVTQGVKTVLDQSRAENDDLPTQHHNFGKMSTDELINFIISATGPAEGEADSPGGTEP